MTGTGRTRWAEVTAAFGAGVIGAAHIGKVPALIPIIRAEFAMDLLAAGWVVSIFSATGMVAGMAAGLLSDRLGHRRVALAGVILLATGSAVGSDSASAGVLLATRFIEGLGYIVAVVAAPSIIAEAALPADRRLAVGVWGAFMPTGMGALLLASPFLEQWLGWRGLWLAMAMATGAWALVMAGAFRGRIATHEVPEAPWRNFAITIIARGPWLLALCFGSYTLAWLALMVWLPTFMVEERGLSVGLAASVTVIAVLVNLPGNLMGGWLLHKGIPRGTVIAIAAVTMIVSGPLIFLDLLSDGPRYAVCLVYSFAAGFVPAGVFSGAPLLAPGPGQIATTNGLIVQGSHLGQFFGPAVLAATVTWTGGWQAGAWVFVACGVGALAFAVAIGREEARRVAFQGSSESRTP